MKIGFGIILSLLMLMFNLNFITEVKGDEGDTIKLHVFDYSMRGNVKEGWFVFPDSNTRYEKIYMYYSLKCDPLNTPYKCGEWDYLTYTHAYKKTGNYDKFPNFRVDGNTADTFSFMSSPSWNYTSRLEKTISIIDTADLKQVNIGDSLNAVEHTFLQPLLFYRMQFLWKANELKQFGLDSNELKGFHLYLGDEQGAAGRVKIRIKNTSQDSLTVAAIEQNGFTEVYDRSLLVGAGGWVFFPFHTHFAWDSLSNLLIDFSVSHNKNLQSNSSLQETTGWPSALYSNSTDFALDFEGADYVEVPNNKFDLIENEITIALWQFGDPSIQPQNDNIFEAFDSNNSRVLSSHLPWGNSNVYWDAGHDAGSYDRINKAADVENFKNQWNFWVFTKNALSGEMQIYLNGDLWHSGTGKTRKMSGVKSFKIGSNGNGGGNYDGLIDEFSIWNKVLTDEQIRELMYHQADPNAAHFNHLIYYYGFSEGEGVITSDLSDHPVSARLEGLPQWKEHGSLDQFKNFKVSSTRPILVMDQSNYNFKELETVQIDSSQKELKQLVLYNDFVYPDKGTDTLYVWPTYYRYHFDTMGVKMDSFLVHADSTLFREDHAAYYDEKYAQLERFEIGRYITPYGINLDLGKGFLWVYDVSDYASLFHDSVKITSGNWQELHDLEFIMIEGTPARDPLDVVNLWNASVPYTGQQEEILLPKTIKINEDVKEARLKIRTTGHGFGGNENCAEFCAKTHNVFVDGIKRFEQFVWRDNCGSNPVYPQGGTWIYNRANWCPGAEVYTDNYEMGKYISPGDSVDIDYNFQSGYSWNGSGSRPTYVVASQLVTFGEFNFDYDVGIDHIIKPNKWEFYSRENPSCHSPKVMFTNYGSKTISSVLLKYGSLQTDLASFRWDGILKPLESAEVELPFYWGNWDGNDRFRVSISTVNGMVDEYERNNTAYSWFELPPVYHHQLLFYLRTNNAASETSYSLVDGAGKTLYSRNAGSMSNNTMYIDTFDLPVTYGCFKLEIKDAEGDGLSFWANNDGNGTARLRKMGGTFYPPIEADFGNESIIYFTTGWSLGEKVTGSNANELHVYPNPADKKIYVQFNLNEKANTRIQLLDLFGNIVQDFNLGWSQADMFEIKLHELAAGFYFVRFQAGDQIWTKKVLLNK